MSTVDNDFQWQIALFWRMSLWGLEMFSDWPSFFQYFQQWQFIEKWWPSLFRGKMLRRNTINAYLATLIPWTNFLHAGFSFSIYSSWIGQTRPKLLTVYFQYRLELKYFLFTHFFLIIIEQVIELREDENLKFSIAWDLQDPIAPFYSHPLLYWATQQIFLFLHFSLDAHWVGHQSDKIENWELEF